MYRATVHDSGSGLLSEDSNNMWGWLQQCAVWGHKTREVDSLSGKDQTREGFLCNCSKAQLSCGESSLALPEAGIEQGPKLVT